MTDVAQVAKNIQTRTHDDGFAWLNRNGNLKQTIQNFKNLSPEERNQVASRLSDADLKELADVRVARRPQPRRRRSQQVGLTAMLLALATAGLAGCGGCPADSTAVLGPTREPLAQGTRVFSHQGVAHLAFDHAIVRLKELDRGKSTRYCGQRLAAAEGVDDAAIVADLSRQLGQGWLPAEAMPLSAHMRIYRWQSQCSARFYALTVHEQLQPGGDAGPFRAMVSMYPCGG